MLAQLYRETKHITEEKGRADEKKKSRENDRKKNWIICQHPATKIKIKKKRVDTMTQTSLVIVLKKIRRGGAAGGERERGVMAA